MAATKPASTSTSAPAPMLAEDIKKHPEYPYVVWPLEATRKERVSVAAGRGGPFEIACEVHGHGPRKMVLVMGLGGLKTSWQRQTKDFGHLQADKYSVLLLDNRGMGESEKPLIRYSTSEMARDIIEVCDHFGWTEQRQLNIIGVSMGGMIVQEMAMLIPKRIASLVLVSTACEVVNQLPWLEHLRNRINLFIPHSIDEQLVMSKANLYTEEYMAAPDDTEYTVEPFPTSGDRFAAAEILKRETPDYFSRRGFILQAVAAGWHRKTPAQLKQLAESVGRDRIMVVHGTKDRMIPFHHAAPLIAGLEDEAKGLHIRKRIFDGQAHVILIEKRAEFHTLAEEFMASTAKLGS